MRLAVVTIASGRRSHLERQHAGLARSTVRPDDHIVVAMDDPELATWAPDARPTAGPPAGPPPFVAEIGASRDALPLAAARNLGAALAFERGAEVAVFLDVDCIPHPAMLERYADAASRHPGSVLTGSVGYLPDDVDHSRPEAYDEVARVYGFRPNPAPGAVERGRHDLFWSLSFAVDRATWARLGGFFEGYRGYGGEDTDLGMRARELAIDLVWVGGAVAYHQHHPTEDPPVQHLDDILVNGALFRSRWGFWPMRGWLDAFERLGLVRRDAAGSYTRTGVTP
jgi:GT2 family glycosyltransferase